MPGQLVFRNHLIELIQYSPQTKTVSTEPMLIVPSGIMNYYSLDMSRDTSLVAYFAGKGHTVVMPWKTPMPMATTSDWTAS